MICRFLIEFNLFNSTFISEFIFSIQTKLKQSELVDVGYIFTPKVKLNYR